MSSSRAILFEKLQNPFSRSVLLHLVLFLILALYITHAPKLETSQPITIDVIDQANKYAAKEDERNRKIVQKSKGLETDVAKKDSYLSDKTRVVNEEKSAVRPGEVDMAGTTVPVVPHAGAAGGEESKSHPAKAVKLSDLGLKLTPKENDAYEKQRKWANGQTGEAMRGGEYIKGMKEGEVSALNTKEFVFYSYFERVRQQLAQAWEPILRDQIQMIYKKGRKLASNSDYTTRTLVTLSAKGEIVRVQVLEESGAFDLDKAAIQALNKAGPYPNPPKGLVDSNGQVQIRWDFILKT